MSDVKVSGGLPAAAATFTENPDRRPENLATPLPPGVWDGLPPDLFRRIAAHLSARDMARLASASRGPAGALAETMKTYSAALDAAPREPSRTLLRDLKHAVPSARVAHGHKLATAGIALLWLPGYAAQVGLFLGLLPLSLPLAFINESSPMRPATRAAFDAATALAFGPLLGLCTLGDERVKRHDPVLAEEDALWGEQRPTPAIARPLQRAQERAFARSMADPAQRQAHMAHTQSRLLKSMDRAVAAGNRAAVAYLLRKGASPTAKMANDETALGMSARMYWEAPTGSNFHVRTVLRAAHCAGLHRLLEMPAGREQVAGVVAWLDQGGVPLYTHTDGLYPLERVRARLSAAGQGGLPAAPRAAQIAHLREVEALLVAATHDLLGSARRWEGDTVARAIASGLPFAPEGFGSLAAYSQAALLDLAGATVRALLGPGEAGPKLELWKNIIPTPEDRFDDVQLTLYSEKVAPPSPPAAT